MNFSSLKLHNDIVAQTKSLGYKQPTPIQQQAIPALLNKKDIIGLAQTGTGKTLAFLLPIIHHLIITSEQSHKIKVLILAPTRELAEQIHLVTQKFAKKHNINSVAIFGGVKISKQISQLKQGVDIVVACPGRLMDLLERKTIKLGNLQTLVLDEADQMLDMGFLPDIKKIISLIPKQRQTLLFSATMPIEIEKLGKQILKQPQKIQVDKREVTSQVVHSLYLIEEVEKINLLLHLINNESFYSMLVFTRTKTRAITLCQKLAKENKVKATALHGDLSISKRRRAVEDFKKGKFHVLVATDIAARGIDISDISHVINYDVPITPEFYIHRIGRTGRANQTGVAYTFASNKEMILIKQIEKELKKKISLVKHNF